jgi:hypothetical protein
MEWTTPVFAEIKMDAEIGSYQEDPQEPGQDPFFGLGVERESD